MDVVSTFQTLGISLGLGLLVGFQRERVDAPLAGFRTFALITLLGTLSGMLALRLGPWVVVAGILAVAITTAMGNLLAQKDKRNGTGMTTEVAILLMYGVGAYLVFGPPQVAVVLAGGIAVLLHAKPVMHNFVQRLGEEDVRVIMQFVLITLVILPVLPNRDYGPFQVLNPREIWQMVVLVLGISLLGYVALKLFGKEAGLVLSGLIGGVISSTATTVSQARSVSGSKEHVAAAVLVVMLASTVVYARVLLEVFAVAPRAFAAIAPPLAVILVVSILLSVALWWRKRKQVIEAIPHSNPTELKSALVFGVLYALVLLAVAAARQYFGDQGFYLAAGVSGLTDMDAITLSASRLTARGTVSASVAWRAIMIATMANLVFKTAIVAVLAGWPMARQVGMLFTIKIAVGLGILALWPA